MTLDYFEGRGEKRSCTLDKANVMSEASKEQLIRETLGFGIPTIHMDSPRKAENKFSSYEKTMKNIRGFYQH